MKIRGSEIIGIIGGNNTGKTVLAKSLAEKFVKKRNKIDLKKYPKNYYRLAVYDVQDRFGDLLNEDDLSIKVSDDNWCKKLLKLRNSLIILDDYRVLMPKDTMDKDFLNLLQYRAEHGLDIILIAHNPQLVIPRLSYYIDTFCLFYTAGNEKSFDHRLSGSENLKKLKNVIDKEFKSYTQDEYSNLYPNFPYIFYQDKKNKAVLINFKKK